MKIYRSLVILPVSLLLIGGVLSQNKSNRRFGPTTLDQRTLFGVKLRPQAAKLLTEVETLYGKNVREVIDPGLDAKDLAYSEVGSNGVPVIARNALGITETSIVHELYHLRDTAKGFRAIVVGYLQEDATERNRTYSMYLIKTLRDPIQHRRFYPLIRAMGLGEPSSDLQKVIEAGIKQAQQGNNRAPLDEQAVVLNFYKASLEYPDANSIKRLADLYKKVGWGKYLEKALELVRIVLRSDTGTPDGEVNTFIECANRHLEGRAKLVFIENRILKLGSFDLHGAVLQLIISK